MDIRYMCRLTKHRPLCSKALILSRSCRSFAGWISSVEAVTLAEGLKTAEESR